MRIVSLVPSLSRTIVDFGLKSQIVGITKFCVDPTDLHRTAKILGGTKDPDIEMIRSLNPSHIIVNDEENKSEHIAELRKFAPVLTTFPKKISDTTKMLRDLGSFLDCKDTANELVVRFETLLQKLAQPTKSQNRFLYFIWKNPYMIVGKDTYISDFLETLGFKNAYEGHERYPSLSIKELQNLSADRWFFSSEPFPFRKRDLEILHQEWPEHPAAFKIDGKLCSWYGSVVLEALTEADKFLNGQKNHLVSHFKQDSDG